MGSAPFQFSAGCLYQSFHCDQSAECFADSFRKVCAAIEEAGNVAKKFRREMGNIDAILSPSPTQAFQAPEVTEIRIGIVLTNSSFCTLIRHHYEKVR